jgi:hypothetical protein
MALPVKIASGFGVLEYWSIGVLEKRKPEFQLERVLSLLHYSTTPSLQQTAARGKDH